ncbi:YfkD famly protein [Bacillus sp. FJAT-50079]|uniref:YfkD famly protein n=1 Tax=Bacillus sp. FJAT-50079 TaxID=2833577 RepID=UPI001BC90B7A|nr:YfkD famly protein [Bacillus sp. FJAT-50079]MBS4209182.1 YfkD family protein [Bacillus sp. FJAT-50079]
MKLSMTFVKMVLLLFFIVIGGASVHGAEKTFEIPSSVVNIGKENTIPSQAQDQPYLKPSKFTKELLDSAEEPIENPHLIRLLNESAINKSPFSIGMRATIYMGEWPLNYKSHEMNVNWKYQKVNTNVYDNNAGTANHQISYTQQMHKRVKGGLTLKVPHSDDVQKMILLKAMKKSKLPLGNETNIGAGTKHHQIYNVHPKQAGYLDAYVPAVIEKGEVTYGEVYLIIKGTKRKIVVKNATSQPVGAWLPIQDHLSFIYQAK